MKKILALILAACLMLCAAYALAATGNVTIAVKGQDEAFEGWGYEDSDMAIRLINNGCLIKWAGFTSPCFHLWHKNADRTMSPENLSRLETVKRMKKVLPNKPMQESYD